MKNIKKIVLVLIIISCSQLSFSQSESQFINNQLILKFKNTQKPNYKNVEKHQKFENSILNLLNDTYNIQSIKLTGNIQQEDTYIFTFNSDKSVGDLMDLYNKTGLFEYVEPNYISKGSGRLGIPNDNKFNRQWAHVNDGTFSDTKSTIDADMDTDLAWDITKGDPNLIVAILDTGAKLDHPEFAGRIWTNNNEKKDGKDSDSNSYIDDIIGWDFVNKDNDPTDDNGHGTSVTGIALASGNNRIGYAGMNWNSKIMICKVLDDKNEGFSTHFAEGVYYAVNSGASIINMSFFIDQPSKLLKYAIDYAYENNVVVVASAGNNNSSLNYPAKYPKTFAVGSTNPDDTRSEPFHWSKESGSNYGPEIDFVAPGSYIYGLDYKSDTNYNTYYSGTSQAAPHVTGLISLLRSVDPNISFNEIKKILVESSEDQVGGARDTEGWDQYYGHGRINASKALLRQVLNTQTFESLNNNILIYPNPMTAQNSLDISNLINGEYTVSLYNKLGQTVQNKKAFAADSKLNIAIPELSIGTYLLRIKSSENNITLIKKLIVK